MKYSIVTIFLFSTLLHAEQINQEILDIIAQDEEIIVHTEYEKVQDKGVEELKKPIQVQQISEETVTPLPRQEKIEKPNIVQKTNIRKTVPRKSVTRSYKKESERRQMLRKAKYLKKKYELALIKFENWEAKKELLKTAFHKKNGRLDTEFGEGNSYGKKRAQKRAREYYHSLDVEERHIEERVDDAYVKLTEIQDAFLFKYAVPLTDEEMNGEDAPAIEDKTQKIEMLNEYISERSAWKICWEKANELDKVNRVARSIEKLFPKSNLTQNKISDKINQNKAQMQAHVNKYQSIELEYRTKYGISISSSERAAVMLDNINKN